MGSRWYVVQVLWLTGVCVSSARREVRGTNLFFLADAVSVVKGISQLCFIPANPIFKPDNMLQAL